MRVFIAAPFTSVFTPPRFDERLHRLIEAIWDALIETGHTPFSSHRLEAYGTQLRPPGICTAFDFLEMQRADHVIAIPYDSYGVHIELGWASAVGVPITILNVLPESVDELCTSPLLDGLTAINNVNEIRLTKILLSDNKVLHAELVSMTQALKPKQSVRSTKTVAFVSTAFGFGPVSKLVTLAEAIQQISPGISCHFFGSGIDYEFAFESGRFDRLFRVDVDDDLLLECLAVQLDNYDAVVNVLNFPLVEYWSPEKPPMVLVDSLSWIWKNPPNNADKLTHYFVQSFWPLSEFDVPHTLIPPIERASSLNIQWKMDQFKTLVVNLGGVLDPFLPDDLHIEFARTVLEGVSSAVRGSSFEQICACASSPVVTRLHGKIPGIDLMTLDNDEFLKLLGRARLLLTSPGTTTIIEALNIGTPMRFLPPQNWSQALAAEKLASVLGQSEVITLSQCFDGLVLDSKTGEVEGLNIISNLLNELNSSKLLDRLIHDLLYAPPLSSPTILHEWLSCDAPSGQRMVAEAIIDMLPKDGTSQSCQPHIEAITF